MRPRPFPFLLLIPFLLACGSTEEKQEPPRDPMVFRPPPLASELPDGDLWRTARPAGFMDMLRELVEADVVYVGEDHTNPDHHLIQLRVIEYLLDRGRLHAIGMEMFERGFQPALDAWWRGEIGEKELLERTEYAARWGYDFELYRPILEFARRKRLPVIALNVEGEIRRQVREAGLDSIPDEQRRALPAIDTGDEEHRAFLREVYASHLPEGGAVDPGDFERFYVVMCLWDDVMADSIVRWFRTAPDDAQIAVLAGSGHIANRYGIPGRVHRRNGLPYRTLVPLAVGRDGARDSIFARRHADFVWLTPPRPAAGDPE